MPYAYNSRTWNAAQRAKERRKADDASDRAAVVAQRDRHKRALRDRALEAQRQRNAEREQLPMIVPQVVPDVVVEVLDRLRKPASSSPAEQRAARERRDRDRPPLISPELAR